MGPVGLWRGAQGLAGMGSQGFSWGLSRPRHTQQLDPRGSLQVWFVSLRGGGCLPLRWSRSPHPMWSSKLSPMPRSLPTHLQVHPRNPHLGPPCHLPPSAPTPCPRSSHRGCLLSSGPCGDSCLPQDNPLPESPWLPPASFRCCQNAIPP